MLTRQACKGTAVFKTIDDYKNNGPHKLIFEKSTATTLKSSYPLRLHIPEHASTSVCQWLYPITFGGGLVEGDDVTIDVTVHRGASAALVTQSSTKVFGCPLERVTRQTVNMKVEDNAMMVSLPDPIVCFKDAVYQQQQRIEMTGKSNLIMLDWYTAGRIARGEVYDFKSYRSKTQILLDGEAIYVDSVRLQNSPYLDMKSANKHFKVLGAIVLLGEGLSNEARNILNKFGAQKNYGEVYDCQRIAGASPLSFKSNQSHVSGCILKFCTQTTTEAYDVIKMALEPLFPIIGGNPFENKY